MQNLTNEHYPIIAGVKMTTDSEGRFNLNALHKASGEGEHINVLPNGLLRFRLKN